MHRLSYVSAPRASKYNYITLTDSFKENVKRSPEKEIVIYRKSENYRKSLTFSKFQKKSLCIASYLIQKGISKGDHVGIYGPNTLEWLVSEMGILMSGAVAAHLTFDVNDIHLIKDYLENCDCKAIIIDTGEKGEFSDILQTLLSAYWLSATRTDFPMIILMRENKAFREFSNLEVIEKTSIKETEYPVMYPEDTAVILPTSGTSGKAKWVKHSHFALLNTVDTDVLLKTVDLKKYTDRPFSWISGFPIVEMCIGIAVVFTDDILTLKKGSTEVIMNIIEDERCDSAFLTTDFLTDLVYKLDQYSNEKIILSTIITGGQFVYALHSKVIGKICNNLVTSYGSTEALLITFKLISPAIDSFELGNVGKPFSGTEIKIVGENGRLKERGQFGMVMCRSRYTFQGYYKKDNCTSEVLSLDGWYNTGDVGLITQGDELILRGRFKDLIYRGNISIYPSIVEDIIMEIETVRHVSVVAVPDPELYEQACVCFITRSKETSADDIQRYYESKLFSSNQGAAGMMQFYYLQFDYIPT